MNNSSDVFRLEKTTALPVWHQPYTEFLGGRQVHRLFLAANPRENTLLKVACEVEKAFSCTLYEHCFVPVKDRSHLPLHIRDQNNQEKTVYVNVNSLVHRLGFLEEEVRQAFDRGDLHHLIQERMQEINESVDETLKEMELIRLQMIKGKLTDVFRLIPVHKSEVLMSKLNNCNNLFNLNLFIKEVSPFLKDIFNNKSDFLLATLRQDIEEISRLPETDENPREKLRAAIEQVWSVAFNYDTEQMQEQEVVSFSNGYLQKIEGKIYPFLQGQLLGQGGFGDVYAVHNLALKEIRAMKVYANPFTFEMQREGAILGDEFITTITEAKDNKKTDVNIRIMDFHADKEYRIMDGYNKISERLTSDFNPKNELPTILKEFICLVDDFIRVKEKGFIHMDIKPENCMFKNPGEATLIDWENLGQEGHVGKVVHFSREFNASEDLVDFSKFRRINAQVDLVEFNDLLNKMSVFQMGVTFYRLLGFDEYPYPISENGGEIITKKESDKINNELKEKYRSNILANLIVAMLGERDTRPSMEDVKKQLNDMDNPSKVFLRNILPKRFT